MQLFHVPASLQGHPVVFFKLIGPDRIEGHCDKSSIRAFIESNRFRFLPASVSLNV
jgi:hypothetical protein